MCTRKFSLLVAGSLWVLVGLRIGSRAMNWLQPYFEEPNWMLSLLAVSVIIAFVKARTVLRKAVNRNLSQNLEKIDDQFGNYFTGWLKLYGTKGLIIIVLMIALGFLLRWLKATGFDPYNIYGFIYLGISLSLIFSSAYYFVAMRKLDSHLNLDTAASNK